MSTKENPTAATAKRSANDDDDDDESHGMPEKKKKLKLTDLSADILTSIFAQASDNNNMDSILELANSNKRILAVIQEWKCTKCQHPIFVMSTSNDNKPELVVRDNAVPFGCVSCGGNHCGVCDAGNNCSGCDKKECRSCFRSHLEECGPCSRLGMRSYCKGCQGPCKECCQLCGFSFCKHHGDECDGCGIMTCGVHDFSVCVCTFCEKGFCPRCHGQGDWMHSCEYCQKHSCNANGEQSNECPTFMAATFMDGVVCPDCLDREIAEDDH